MINCPKNCYQREQTRPEGTEKPWLGSSVWLCQCSDASFAHSVTLWVRWHARMLWGDCFLWQGMMNIITPSFGLLHFYTFEKRSKPLAHTHRVTAGRPLHSGYEGTPQHLLIELSSLKPSSISVFRRIFPGDEQESTFLCTNGTGSHWRAPGLGSNAVEVRGDLSGQVCDAWVKLGVEVRKKGKHLKHTPQFPTFGSVFSPLEPRTRAEKHHLHKADYDFFFFLKICFKSAHLKSQLFLKKHKQRSTQQFLVAV